MSYDVLLIDCPWKYNSRANHKTRFRGGAGGHYPLMTMAQIKGLPIADIMAKSAVMFMWATFPYLEDQLTVFKAFGFKYKTVGFTWVKLNVKNGKPFFGVGYYSKSNAEVCLLGTRGKVMKPAVNTVSSVIITPRGIHSAKPDEARERISLMYPYPLKKVEIFARSTAPGWDSIGNEMDGRDVKEALLDYKERLIA